MSNCDDADVVLRYERDVSDLAAILGDITHGVTLLTDRITQVLTAYLLDYDFEEKTGIHFFIDHRPDPNTFSHKYMMVYGFDNAEDEIIYQLKGANIDEAIEQFRDWFSEVLKYAQI